MTGTVRGSLAEGNYPQGEIAIFSIKNGYEFWRDLCGDEMRNAFLPGAVGKAVGKSKGKAMREEL